MNQTSSTTTSTPLSSGTDFTALLTNAHLIWLVIFAAVVIAAIIYGSLAKARRRAAERQVADHAAEAGVEAAPVYIGETVDVPTPTPPTSIDGDAASGPVTQLKGLGPKVAARLGELGIATVGQLAALDHDAAQALDAQLGAFAGRMERDRWIEQARFLAAGDVKGFEAVFGRLGGA